MHRSFADGQKYSNRGTPRSKQSLQTLDHDPYSSGITPPWMTLPYHILLQIFQYASYPLYDEYFRPMPSADWLLGTSRLCHSFAEPALTILYRSPPLVPMEHAHRLLQLLMADQAPMSFKYRAKVERLQMEVSQTAAYTLVSNPALPNTLGFAGDVYTRQRSKRVTDFESF